MAAKIFGFAPAVEVEIQTKFCEHQTSELKGG